MSPNNIMNLLLTNWLLIIIVLIGILALASYISRNFEVSEITATPPWVKLMRKSVSDKRKVSMVQFTIDETESIYRASHFDPSGEIMHQRMGLFERLESVGYHPRKISLVVEERHDASARKTKNKEFLFPLFFITLQNDNSKQIVANTISLRIYKVMPVMSTAESSRLDSVGTYKIAISPEIGVYQQQMIPPIRIAPHDAISFKLRVLPKSEDGELSKGGTVLIADVSVHWDVGTTTSPRFTLDW